MGFKWEDSKVATGAQLYWYNHVFSKSNSPTQGYKIYFKNKTDRLPFNLRYEKSRNNIVNNPDEKTIQKKNINLNTFIPNKLFDITTNLSYEKTKSIYTPLDKLEENKEIWIGNININKQFENLNMGLEGSIDSCKNIIQDKRQSELLFYPEIGYNWGNLKSYLGYGLRGNGKSIKEAKDNLTTVPIIKLNYQSDELIVDNLSLDYTGGNMPTLAVNSQLNILGNLDLNIDGEAEKKQNETEWKIRTGLTTNFDLPIPWIYSQGKLKGAVYLEEMGEKKNGIENIILKANNKKVSTNNKGQFAFSPMSPGKYVLKIRNLPFNYNLKSKMPREVIVKKGKTTNVNIKLKRVTQISGKIYYDKKKAQERLVSELNKNSDFSLANICIELWQGDKLIKTVYSDSNGFYHISNLNPGTYKVTINTITLPDRFEVTTENPIRVSLENNDKLHLNFGIVEKPLEINITYNN